MLVDFIVILILVEIVLFYVGCGLNGIIEVFIDVGCFVFGCEFCVDFGEMKG